MEQDTSIINFSIKDEEVNARLQDSKKAYQHKKRKLIATLMEINEDFDTEWQYKDRLEVLSI